MSPQATRDPITCHILDTHRGRPASSVLVQLYNISPVTPDTFSSTPFAQAKTDADGRITKWNFDPDVDAKSTGVEDNKWVRVVPGDYKIKFLTGKYFAEGAGNDNGDGKGRSFFPYVEVVFTVDDVNGHYHIPLLLSNYSYTTYRGS
ncbi:hypothetical protein PVL30_003251 [Lodderomyces elongisporus]|uniref:uncharacterized protein n=1 Tax=Lodderomyces elongisporus TaxID=36914 RepID=UPI002923B09A|nr:uncharacterized protein PVL30_003251 [Lodderomyces elongisporus]WLF79496.1 hypothetical protein PVL30_003251 [Lodderomyces elongisporus]